MRALVFLLLSAAGHAAPPLPEPPQLSAAGRAEFGAFLAAPSSKAFAIAPGGAWGWSSGEASPAGALDQALARCRQYTDQTCVPYAADGQRVFDDARWVRSWRPYSTAASAAQAGEGLLRGARFPEIEFVAPDGRPMRLSDFRGEVVVLHFWASWCAPCRRELPDLAAVARQLRGRRVRFVPLQVREPIDASRRWLQAQQLDLPLYDSGMKSIDDGVLRVKGGGQLPDRAVAKVFPSSVVLDRNGIVLLTHYGPIERWAEYAPLLRDAAAAR